MNIFVGNLSFDATQGDVSKLFEGFGSVASVVIMMQKDGKKSRGFGFVEMLDDQQAQAAIAALGGKEFMGRPLNVEAARTKSKAGPESRKIRKIQPVFHKTGGYKEGRRSRSFMMQRAAAGIEEQASPKRKSQENPMRWRKKRGQPKPWQKSQGESKPWRKAEGGSRPWKKTTGESRPWEKTGGESRLWIKAEGKSRPWRKTEGQTRPWKKAEGDSRPWKKARGESKPWRKSNEPAQQSRFKRRGK